MKMTRISKSRYANSRDQVMVVGIPKDMVEYFNLEVGAYLLLILDTENDCITITKADS